jgi:hypothetical protein
MGDHAIPHEPEKDRALLSVVAVIAALGLALFSWKAGHAAPTPIRSTAAAPRGAVAVEHGDRPQVEFGRVLQRGGTVHVLNPGSELIIPRSRVIEVDANSTKNLPKKYKPQPKKSRPALAPRRAAAKQGVGTVINHAGRVFVGRLKVDEQAITVTSREGKKTVKIPRQDVRWHALGVEGPNASYYRRHAGKPIDSKYARRPPRAPSARAVADNHRLAGRWAKALEAYIALYLQNGETTSLAELRRAARRWIHLGQNAYAVDQRLQTFRKLITPQGMQQAALRKALGDELQAAKNYLPSGDLQAVEMWAKRLVSLGGDLAVQGQQLLEVVKERRK